MPLTPSERSLRARIAAHALHAGTDSTQLLQPAREAFLRKFELEVDPDGVLNPEERARRAEQAKKVYFLTLALKSAKARRAKAGGAA